MADDAAVITEDSESKDLHPSARRRSPRPTPVIERNVRALLDHAAELERMRSAGGSPRTRGLAVYWKHAIRVSARRVLYHWALGDLGWIPGLPEYDTSFTVLGTIT